MFGANETHSEKYQIDGQLDIRAFDLSERHPPLVETLLNLVVTKPSEMSVLVAEKCFSIDAVDPLTAFGMR